MLFRFVEQRIPSERSKNTHIRILDTRYAQTRNASQSHSETQNKCANQ